MINNLDLNFNKIKSPFFHWRLNVYFFFFVFFNRPLLLMLTCACLWWLDKLLYMRVRWPYSLWFIFFIRASLTWLNLTLNFTEEKSIRNIFLQININTLFCSVLFCSVFFSVQGKFRNVTRYITHYSIEYWIRGYSIQKNCWMLLEDWNLFLSFFSFCRCFVCMFLFFTHSLFNFIYSYGASCAMLLYTIESCIDAFYFKQQGHGRWKVKLFIRFNDSKNE